MPGTLKKNRERYTWKDYLSWPEDERWEIVNGEAFRMDFGEYSMSPSLAYRHQHVILNLAVKMKKAFEGKKCLPILSPMDVKLTDDIILQPDIMVVCDQNKIMEAYIDGAPDLVVEVISRSSVAHDKVRKLKIYAEFGVKEYWILNPYPAIAEILVLTDGKYMLEQVCEGNGTLKSSTFPFLKINLSEIFDFPLSPDEEKSEKLRLREPISRYGSINERQR